MRRYLIALLVAVSLIGGMLALQAYMHHVDYYLTTGGRLSLLQRLLIAIAIFWGSFWWLLVPFIIAACVGFAGLLHLHTVRQQDKQQTPRSA